MMHESMFMHKWTFYHFIAYWLGRFMLRFPNCMNRNKIKVKTKVKGTQWALLSFDLNFYRVSIYSVEYLLEEKRRVLGLVFSICMWNEVTTIDENLDFMVQPNAVVSIMSNCLMELENMLKLKLTSRGFNNVLRATSCSKPFSCKYRNASSIGIGNSVNSSSWLAYGLVRFHC